MFYFTRTSAHILSPPSLLAPGLRSAAGLQVSIESFGFPLTVTQLPFPTPASLFHEKCDLLKARVVLRL